ncbi:MAG: CapA family protein [Lachnospiraceae bacterium]|nr:CapA family protein [Lachnospiraceae bacterium]
MKKGIKSFACIVLVLALSLTGCQKRSDAEQTGSSSAETVSSSEAKKEPEKVTLCMVGDILLHDRLEQAAKQEDGSYNYDFIFKELKSEISSKDLAIVNQEVIIGGKELGVSGYPNFNASVEIADALNKAGFDVVCHATNHALDRGATGITNTIKNWKEKYPDITITGIHDSKEDKEKIRVVEKNGIKIAILNYTYGTNGIALPNYMPYAVDLLSEEKVRADIKKAESMADFTIVVPHWGTEDSLKIDNSQKAWVKVFRECGADLILGAHPHVIEEIERLDETPSDWSNNKGNGDMLVYYSVGNFVNWTEGTGYGTANRMVGGIAEITIERKPSGEVAIADYGVLPIVTHVSTDNSQITVYPLDKYTPELAAANAIRKQDASFRKEYCESLVKKVWPQLT